MNENKKGKVLTTHLDEELSAKLEAMAAKEYRSQQSIVRQLISEAQQ